jgi:hypothetical protein
MQTATKFFFLIFLNYLVGSNFAAANNISCPAHVPNFSSTDGAKNNGWNLQVDQKLILNGVGFKSGPLDSNRYLKPDDGTESKTTLTQVWNFQANLDGKWVVCYFGDRDLIALSRRLPDEITQCTVVQQKLSRQRLKHQRYYCN